ncbi:MAG: STAS domain-containing protein [Halieaceae bacterium]
MSAGRILAADHDGAYALKLIGDVRVNLCSSVDDYLDQMFADSHLDSVLVDLCEAEGVDSTTLGLLAKLALRYRRRFNLKPVIYSSNPGINRLLKSMAFSKLFDIREELCANDDSIRDIPTINDEPEAVREKVIEAHRVLMDISEENQERFRDLVTALEQD